jgi:hypothetical protein
MRVRGLIVLLAGSAIASCSLDGFSGGPDPAETGSESGLDAGDVTTDTVVDAGLPSSCLALHRSAGRRGALSPTAGAPLRTRRASRAARSTSQASA